MDLSHFLKLTSHKTGRSCYIDVDDIKHILCNGENCTLIRFHDDRAFIVMESPTEIYTMMGNVDMTWFDKIMDFFGL